MLIFIGTLHNMMPSCEADFEQTLNHISPQCLLIEIEQLDLEALKTDTYPLEMQFAYAYAKKTHIPVYGFDAHIDVRSSQCTPKKEEAVEHKQLAALGFADWKQANKALYDSLNALASAIIDPLKWDQRQRAMFHNIQESYNPIQKTLVITGCAHLSFFEKQFPKAAFPFR